jgi:hypothetical protein
LINIWVAVRNPWVCKPFEMISHWCSPVTKNKNLELQLSRYCFNLFEFKLDLNWRQTDHAGPWISVNLFGWIIDARIFDSREWDDNINDWKK